MSLPSLNPVTDIVIQDWVLLLWALSYYGYYFGVVLCIFINLVGNCINDTFLNFLLVSDIVYCVHWKQWKWKPKVKWGALKSARNWVLGSWSHHIIKPCYAGNRLQSFMYVKVKVVPKYFRIVNEVLKEFSKLELLKS